MPPSDAEVKTFSSSERGRKRISQATSTAISQQIEENRPLILSDLGKVCESRGGQLTGEQVAAVAAIISHLHHPSEIFERLANWLADCGADRSLARDWLATAAGKECVFIAWFDAESRRDMSKDELTGLMEISDEEAEALELTHLISDRLRKRVARRAEGIQARKKDEPWKDQGISKAAYYRKLAAEKGVSRDATVAPPQSQSAEPQPWVKLGISRATYFRQKTKETSGEIEQFDATSNSETPGETRTSGSCAHANPSSFLYISGRSSLTSSLTPITTPRAHITDPIACARARDRGDGYYYFIVASRDMSKRLSDLQHLDLDHLIDFEAIEDGEYPQSGYTGTWAFQSRVSFFPDDVDLAPKPIEPMKRLKSSLARQFAHKALQLGLTWEDSAYWEPENPWTWFVDDERSNANDVHTALSPLAERFWADLRRSKGIAAKKARKAAKTAPEPANVEFNAATMHPSCCSAEDWSVVPLPLRNRALIIAGDLFLRGVWQQMDCLAIGIIGAERAETRRKMLAQLCPRATPVELETAAINCWQASISEVPKLAAWLNELVAERIRIETAHLQPPIIKQMDWIMAREWAEEMVRGDVDRDKVRERLAKTLIEIDAGSQKRLATESLKQAVKRVRDPRFEPTTKADEDYSKALTRRWIMTIEVTAARR